jgi:hypothetical protein
MNQPECEYMRKNENTNFITMCGKPAVVINLPQNKQVKKYLGKRTRICLCEEHRAFVIDAIMPVEKIITEKPKGFDLL